MVNYKKTLLFLSSITLFNQVVLATGDIDVDKLYHEIRRQESEDQKHQKKMNAALLTIDSLNGIHEAKLRYEIETHGLLTVDELSEETLNVIANKLTPVSNTARENRMGQDNLIRKLVDTRYDFNKSYKAELAQRAEETGVTVHKNNRKYKQYKIDNIYFLQACPTFKETAYNHRYFLGLSAAFIGYTFYAAWSWNKGNNFIGQKAFSPLFQYTAKHINNTLNTIGKKIIERPAFTATVVQQTPTLAQKSVSVMVAQPTGLGRLLGNLAFKLVPQKVTL